MKRASVFACVIGLTFLCCKKEAEEQIDTQNPIQIKTLTASASNYYAQTGGDIADDGGELITSRGICWSQSENPTIKDSTIISGAGTGIFNVVILNLQADHRYYAKAFATNRLGTVYGNRISFITKVFSAVFASSQSSNITQTTAEVKARIVDNGGAPVTERGFLWDTIMQPNFFSSQRIAVGSDTGTYTLKLTGLIPYTRYSVSPYAINKRDTAYASTTYFTTLAPLPPTVTTDPLVLNNGVVITGGTVTASSGVVVGERGIVYSTNKEPGVNNKVVSGSGTGSFTATFTRRYTSSGSGYSVRAYAEYTYKSLSNTVYGESQQLVVP